MKIWLLRDAVIDKAQMCGFYAQRRVVLFGSVLKEFQFEGGRQGSDLDPILVRESRCVAIGSWRIDLCYIGKIQIG